MGEQEQPPQKMVEFSIPSSSSSSPSMSELEEAELQYMPLTPPLLKSNNRRFMKQMSMRETSRDVAWERRRRQMLMQEHRRNRIHDADEVTDEDLRELQGCIELGFGFNEEEGQKLCNTLPALDLYFAVNRQLSPSPVSTPPSRHSTSSISLEGRSSSFGSPTCDSDSWKIFSPGDNPQTVKTKLRHWAQAVACSVMQSS